MRTAPATGRLIAMVQVKTLRGFRNTDEDGNRAYVSPNTTLEVSEQRAKDLEQNGLIERTSTDTSTKASSKKAAGTPKNKAAAKPSNKSATDTDPADTGTGNGTDSAGSEGGSDSDNSGSGSSGSDSGSSGE